VLNLGFFFYFFFWTLQNLEQDDQVYLGKKHRELGICFAVGGIKAMEATTE
jgi:hypothetical protein